MQVKCLPESLRDGLKIAGRAVSRHATLPVLRNVCISANGNGAVAVSGSDLEVSIRTWGDAKVEQPGALTVPAGRLSDLTALLTGSEMTMRVERSDLKIECGGTSATLKGIPADEFIQIKDYDALSREDHTIPHVVMDPSTLETALDRTVISAARDDSRPVLSTVYVHENEHGCLSFVSADGFRMSVQHTDVPANGFPDVLIPYRAIEEAARIIATESEPARVVAGSSDDPAQVAFIFSNTHLVTQLVHGKFPDYRQIIPQQFVFRALVVPSELKRAIKTALIFGRDQGDLVTWTVQNTGDDQYEMIVSGNSVETGDNTSRVNVDVEGDMAWTNGPFKIAVNAKYVIQALDAIGSIASLEIWFNESSAPILMRPAGDTSYTHIVMPMHVGR